MSAEKKHPATPRKRQKAKAEGRYVKSHDLTTSGLMVASCLVLWFAGETLLQQLVVWLGASLTSVSATSMAQDQLSRMLAEGIMGYGWMVGPLLGTMLCAVIAMNMIQTGFVFSANRLRPELKKINPISTLKAIWSVDGMMKFAFGLLKITVVVFAAAISLSTRIDRLAQLPTLELAEMFTVIFHFLLGICITISLSLLGLAILDYLLQRWKFEKDLMMTDEELREEMREAEVHSEMRIKRQKTKDEFPRNKESLTGRAEQEIVLTSQADLAVSVVFGNGARRTPRLLRKGLGEIAHEISEQARARGALVMEHTMLANAIHSIVEEGQSVPVPMSRDLSSLLPRTPEIVGM